MNNINIHEKLQLAIDDILKLGTGYDEFVNKLLDSSDPEQKIKGVKIINNIENDPKNISSFKFIQTVIDNLPVDPNIKNQLIELAPKYIFCQQLLIQVDFKSIKKTEQVSEYIQEINIEI